MLVNQTCFVTITVMPSRFVGEHATALCKVFSADRQPERTHGEDSGGSGPLCVLPLRKSEMGAPSIGAL